MFSPTQIFFQSRQWMFETMALPEAALIHKKRLIKRGNVLRLPERHGFPHVHELVMRAH